MRLPSERPLVWLFLRGTSPVSLPTFQIVLHDGDDQMREPNASYSTDLLHGTASTANNAGLLATMAENTSANASAGPHRHFCLRGRSHVSYRRLRRIVADPDTQPPYDETLTRGVLMMVLVRHALVHGRFNAAAGTSVDAMEYGHLSRLPVLVEDVGPVMGKVVPALVVSHMGLQRLQSALDEQDDCHCLQSTCRISQVCAS